MSTLFDELAAEDVASGQRRVHALAPTDDAPSFPKLSGIEQFQAIFMEEARRDDVPVHIPDDATIERMKGSGWKRPRVGSTGKMHVNEWAERDPDVDCHRWFIEQIPAIPVEDLLQMHVIQARDMVHRLLSPRTGGTFHHVLTQMLSTNNGAWVPVEIAFRKTVKPYLDGVKDAVFKAPTDEGIISPLAAEDIGINKAGIVSGWKQAVNVNKEALEIVIRWADLRNAHHVLLDVEGKPVAGVSIKVQAPAAAPQADMSALADAMRALAERPVVVQMAAPAPAPEVKAEPPKVEAKPEAPKPPGRWAPKDPTK